MTARHYSKSQNLVISFEYSWFLAKNLFNFVSLPWKLHNRKCHNVLTISFRFFGSIITPLVFFIIDGIIRFVLNLPFGLFALFFGFTSPLSSFFGILSLTGEKISCIWISSNIWQSGLARPFLKVLCTRFFKTWVRAAVLSNVYFEYWC